VASLAVWLVMSAGGGLWTAVAATAARLACDVCLLAVYYHSFFGPFLQAPPGPRVDWITEIWPLQWRLGLGAVFSYFAFSLFVPVMFHYHPDGGIAGRMGMTWTVVTAIQAAALAWVQTRVPRLGMLVQQRAFVELDRVFFRISGFGLAAMLLAGAAFWSVVWLLNAAQLRVAERLLAPLPTLVFLLAAVLQWGAASLAYYVRAHKREPFLLSSIISNAAIGVVVWQLGAAFGPLGAACGLLGVLAIFTLPAHLFLRYRCRREFDSGAAGAKTA
jgi:hypothetical protein